MTDRNSKSPSASEHHCRSQFDRFLHVRLPEADITWGYVPVSEQPPDYYLDVNGRRYAVEVTGLMPLVEVDGKALQEASVVTALWRLVAQIKQDAIAERILEGQYEIYFSKPVQNLKRERRQITIRVLDYLRRTRFETSAADEVILPDTCLIRKLANTRAAIYPVGPGGGGWEAKLRREARELLANATAIKLEKLKAKGITLPTILLLENHHIAAELEYYLDALTSLSAADYFHTIVLIRGEQQLLLRTEESAWAR